MIQLANINNAQTTKSKLLLMLLENLVFNGDVNALRMQSNNFQAYYDSTQFCS